jgi:hypothetical protein
MKEGCWMLDTRYWMLDTRYLMLDTRLHLYFRKGDYLGQGELYQRT